MLLTPPHISTEVSAITSLPTASRSGCPKCGTIKKSAKRSCCARGGAWFKNCGDAGDPRFDHTWTEGIQACQSSARSASNKSPLQVMIHGGGLLSYSLSTADSRNSTGHQENSTQVGIVLDTKLSSTACDGCVVLATVVVTVFGFRMTLQ